MELKNKSVILTGATSGIGRALALELARTGCKLFLVGRNIELLQQVRSECCIDNSSEIFIFQYDLSEISGVEQLVQKILAQANEIDLFIHCAGANFFSTIEKLNIDQLNHSFSVNYFSAVAFTRSLLPTLIQKNVGKLVYFSSGTAHFGVPGQTIYSSTKAALERFFEGLTIELIDTGVETLLISPGPVSTKMLNINNRNDSQSNKKIFSNPSSANEIAQKVVSIIKRKSNVKIQLSLKPIVARHLAYWFPQIYQIIFRNFREK